MKLTKLFLASISALVFCSAGSALAAEKKTADLAVSVNVKNNCTITTVAVAFPDYDPIITHLTAPDDSNAGSVTITCNKGGATSVDLSLGGNADLTQPRMKNGSDYLPYMLYSGSHGGTAWSGASLSVAGGMSQAAQVIPVYGRIPAAQPAIFGTYNDTVVATVNF